MGSFIESEKLLNATTTDSLSSTSLDVQLECADEEECCVQDKTLSEKIVWGVVYTLVSTISLYFFMVGVKLIGDGFTLTLGCNAKGAPQFSGNPVADFMIGTVATALLHSSGAVTSIVVALVGSGGITIRQGVYLIMGANVGTCVTCIVVAFQQLGDRTQFQRAVAAATVHDMYNIWSVLVMFPIEVIFHPLEKMSVAMSKTSSGLFDSPVDMIARPMTQTLLVVDKEALYKITTGESICTNGQSFVKGGVFGSSSMSDSSIGAITVFLGFCILVCALLTLVKMLAKAVMEPTKKLILKLLNCNGYTNIVVGTVITFAVHSSTVVTSTLTPMAGLGVITLEQVYPLVIGANLGTTSTALLASLVTGESNAVAIALVHFWFNVFGIFLFYPIPITRELILGCSESLACASASWPLVAVLFLVILFILVPADLLILMAMGSAHSGVIQFFGWIITLTEIIALGYFIFWYEKKGGRIRWHDFLEKRSLERQDGLEWFHTHEMN